MSITPRPSGDSPNSSDAYTPTGINRSQALQHCFYKSRSGWFVQHSEHEKAGPYADKAEAQMAMLYYSARTFWPSEKQLREFTRSGR